MLAPARMPVAAGKKMANTEKNPSSPLNSGPKFSANIEATKEKGENICVKFQGSPRDVTNSDKECVCAAQLGQCVN